MKAIILCAGSSTRTYPLTLTRPKPLLKIANKPLLAYNLEKLEGFIDEAILVVGYKKEMIKEHFGNRFNSIKIRYIEQKEQSGTGNALMQAKDITKGRFFVLMGDDLYPENGIKQCKSYRYSVLASKAENPENFGVYVVENSFVKNLVEKPKTFISNLANTGLYVLDEKIFEMLENLKKTERGEYELTDAVRIFAENFPVRCITTKEWIPIGYPWDLLNADQKIRGKKNSIGKKTIIKGIVINSSIGNNCTIKGIVKNSLIMDNAIIDEDSVVEDSIIGENVYFNGIIKSGENLTKEINGKQILIKKFGAAIGDNVNAGNIQILPGTLICPGKELRNAALTGDR